MVKEMCGVLLVDIKRDNDIMLMLGLNETLGQLAIANSAHWHGHVLMRKNGHVLMRKNGHVLRMVMC